MRVFGVIEHSYRQALLRALEKGPMKYSQMLALVEPESAGRGRYNYHLRILREAGLVTQEDQQYRLTPTGEAAATLMREELGDVVPQARRELPETIVGSILGLGVWGLALLVSVLLPGGGGVGMPWSLFVSSLWVGSPFLIILVVLYRKERLPRPTATRASLFLGSAAVAYLLLALTGILVALLVSPFPAVIFSSGVDTYLRLFILPPLSLALAFAWLLLLKREMGWDPWHRFREVQRTL